MRTTCLRTGSLVMRIGSFLEVERYEQSKYHRLDESHKHLKEIKWDQEEVSEWESLRTDFRRDPEHDTEENRSSKYITKETQ